MLKEFALQSTQRHKQKHSLAWCGLHTEFSKTLGHCEVQYHVSNWDHSKSNLWFKNATRDNRSKMVIFEFVRKIQLDGLSTDNNMKCKKTMQSYYFFLSCTCTLQLSPPFLVSQRKISWWITDWKSCEVRVKSGTSCFPSLKLFSNFSF